MKVLLTSKSCSGCEVAKRQLENDIKRGKVKVVDVNTKLGISIVKLQKITTVPTLINLEYRGYKDTQEFSL